MKNVPTKSTGNQLTANEFNLGWNDELKNTVEDSGQTLSESDLFQLGKALAVYVGSGDFYGDSGTPNNYILAPLASKQAPTQYDTGLRMRFIPASTNTGASIVNLFGLGVKNIKTAGGSDPGAGAIIAGTIIELVYDGTNAVIYNTSISGSEFSTGDAKITVKTVADAGWIIMDDGTIGSSTSGATTRANNDTELLFKLLWNNVLDTWAPVIGGRGASAAADWTANKQLTLTRQLGRTLGISGAGGGLTARVLGEYLGEEDHQLTIAELAAHLHGSPYSSTAAGLYGDFVTATTDKDYSVSTTTTQNSKNTSTTGSDTPHNTMQPSSFWNVMIKL